MLDFFPTSSTITKTNKPTNQPTNQSICQYLELHIITLYGQSYSSDSFKGLMVFIRTKPLSFYFTIEHSIEIENVSSAMLHQQQGEARQSRSKWKNDKCIWSIETCSSWCVNGRSIHFHRTNIESVKLPWLEMIFRYPSWWNLFCLEPTES